jgi:superfamily II DNA or RNA helicase
VQKKLVVSAEKKKNMEEHTRCDELVTWTMPNPLPRHHKPVVWKTHQCEWFHMHRDVVFGKSVRLTTPWRRLLMGTMGSGKTLMALGTMLYARQRPRRILILTSKSVLSHWKNEMRRIFPAHGEPAIQVHLINLSNAVYLDHVARSYDAVIIDEFHMFKNLNDRVLYLLHQLSSVSHVLLLSGTPLKNSREDCKGLFALMGGVGPYDPECSDTQLIQQIHRCCQGRVFYFDPLRHTIDGARYYPQVTYHTIYIPYDTALHHARYSDFRREMSQRKFFTTLSPANPKIQWVLDRIRDGVLQTPLVLYSNYVEEGCKLFQKALSQTGYRTALVDGSVPTKERAAIFTRFNNNRQGVKGKRKDDIDVLCFSRAVSEGVDLKGARHMVLIDPQDPLADEEQTIARCIRMFSHAPGSHVSVYRLIATWDQKTVPATIEQVLVERRKQKALRLEVFIQALRDVASVLHTPSYFALPPIPRAFQKVGVTLSPYGYQIPTEQAILAPLLSAWLQKHVPGRLFQEKQLLHYLCASGTHWTLLWNRVYEESVDTWWQRYEPYLAPFLAIPPQTLSEALADLRWFPKGYKATTLQRLWPFLEPQKQPQGQPWTRKQLQSVKKPTSKPPRKHRPKETKMSAER